MSGLGESVVRRGKENWLCCVVLCCVGNMKDVDESISGLDRCTDQKWFCEL